MEAKQIQHLYWRAGFGIAPNQLKKLQGKSRKAIVGNLFDTARSIEPLTLVKDSVSDVDFMALRGNKKALREFGKKLREQRIHLNKAWIDKMVSSDNILREKMTLFWATHFVCREPNGYYAEQYNNTLRKHALGNFRTFVKAISKEVAMIKYLNLDRNKKAEPNENFARELMELFTLGKGHYSENDIKESAKAFTGYGYRLNGEFHLYRTQHDYSVKRFFNRRGRFDGDDIIDIILLEKQCARFVCEKIYRYFVNENISKDHVDKMISVFYPKYDIGDLMYYVFTSDWFYDEAHIGTKIKSPTEFIVGLSKVVNLKFTQPKQLVTIQKFLGQILMDPPNVAGWPGGRNWIDSNTILVRLRAPSVLLNSNYISIKEKGEFGDRLSQFIKRKGRRNYIKTTQDWNLFDIQYKAVSIEEMPNYILQTQPYGSTETLLNNLSKESKKEYCVQLMSLPEYQMC